MVARKTVTVPKDKDAENALDYDEATPDQLLEVLLTDEEFDELWAAGVFDIMNEITGAMIDYFESAEIVEKEKLEKVLESDAFTKDAVVDKLAQIKVLFEEALERGTGVYFFF
ncbi:hypothetical protein [Chitinophaga sp. CF418]|uniref:hypothetical protein n=1 Tax=Chitinophaga sp. CF418 TaxID=1855287 RepID=UPI00122D3A06|nr:hypothetical protein [Chitinophaga sp. CF418]